MPRKTAHGRRTIPKGSVDWAAMTSDWWRAADSELLSRSQRTRRQETGEPEAEEPEKREPLVAQGGRSAGIPRPRPSFDDLLRRRGAGVWQRII
ncbi:MAG TPA: hypothetical protein VFC61_01080 [Blastocatellia bacterium]|nr:hypothetical protein [Blastocatellia bacterium]